MLSSSGALLRRCAPGSHQWQHPTTINGWPIDTFLAIKISAALERNRDALGITKDQVNAMVVFIADECERWLPCRHDEDDSKDTDVPPAPVVRLERYVSRPDIDGSVLKGWSFLAGECEVFFSDGYSSTDYPTGHSPILKHASRTRASC